MARSGGPVRSLECLEVAGPLDRSNGSTPRACSDHLNVCGAAALRLIARNGSRCGALLPRPLERSLTGTPRSGSRYSDGVCPIGSVEPPPRWRAEPESQRNPPISRAAPLRLSPDGSGGPAGRLSLWRLRCSRARARRGGRRGKERAASLRAQQRLAAGGPQGSPEPGQVRRLTQPRGVPRGRTSSELSTEASWLPRTRTVTSCNSWFTVQLEDRRYLARKDRPSG